MAPAASLTPVYKLVTAAAAASTLSSLAMELPAQVAAGTSFAQALVASPTLPFFPPIQAVFLPIRAIESISRRHGRKRYRNSERSSPERKFNIDEELMCTHLKILPIRGYAFQSVQRAARSGRETITNSALPPAVSRHLPRR